MVRLEAGIASQPTSPTRDTTHTASDVPVNVNVAVAVSVADPPAEKAWFGNLGVVVSTVMGPDRTLQIMPLLLSELAYDPAWNLAVVMNWYVCPTPPTNCRSILEYGVPPLGW